MLTSGWVICRTLLAHLQRRLLNLRRRARERNRLCNGGDISRLRAQTGLLPRPPPVSSFPCFYHLHHLTQLLRSQGYKYSVFNLVFANNPASSRIWDRLGFQVLGRVPGAGRLANSEELVDALIYGRSLV